MKLKKNSNALRFQAIKNPEDIDRIRSNLHKQPRDLLLFDLATQTGIGLKKLLSLKVSHLINLKIGDKLPIKESANGKYSVVITDVIYETFHEYLKKIKPDLEDFLFKSRRGSGSINLSSASNMINSWYKKANIKNVQGSMSLRKTWEYNQMKRSPYGQNGNSLGKYSFFKPLETTTAQEIIFRELSKAIISCRIPPGTRLTTAEISRAFNVSHAPARVALNWLEARGFITVKKKKASIVKRLSFKEMKEILDIRLILETAALGLSIESCTEETIELAESIIYELEKSMILEEYDKLNTRFHQIIYRDVDMPLLQEMILDLCNKISPYIILRGDYGEFEPSSQHYHRGIIEGMRNREKDKAIKYLTLDLTTYTPRLKEIIEKNML